jgi:succinate dehydrogenase / fumarate reductase flavoprotein subunit
MMDTVGIYRSGDEMQAALAELQQLGQAARNVSLTDANKAYNTELLELLELQNLLALALISAASANNRRETRGAHAREDFPQRDDEKYLSHTLCWLKDGSTRLDTKPVDLSIWKPKPRQY